MSAERKTELRTHFARNLDDQYDTDEVQYWIHAVGEIMGKKDIMDNAQAIAEYLVDVKGFQTGEEFVMAERTDLEEGRTNGQWEISDVSIRTLWRYLTSRVEVHDDGNTTTSINGNTGTGNTTNGGISTGAEHALLKIANAANQKLPEYKEKYVGVKLVIKHVKLYAHAKKNEWEGTGMFEAFMSLLKHADWPKAANLAEA